MLTQLDALFTAGLASVPRLPMFRLDFLALEAVVMVVIDLSMFWRLFDGVSVVRRYFCHLNPPCVGFQFNCRFEQML
jgi:hypothetical protein